MLYFTWVLIRGVDHKFGKAAKPLPLFPSSVPMYDCFYAGTLFKSEIMQNGQSFSNGKLESSFVTFDQVGGDI